MMSQLIADKWERKIMTADNKHWRNFINKYKSFPELWKIDCDKYRCKYTRKRSFETLLDYYRKIDPNATVHTMKRRIHNMRIVYKRELNKRKKTNIPDWEPTLWYFKVFDEFLCDQDITNQRSLCRVSPIIFDFEGDNNEDEKTIAGKRNKHSKEMLKHEAYSNSSMDDINDNIDHDATTEDPLLATVNNIMECNKIQEQVKDDAAVFADSWAVSYRKLSSEQQLYAKKAIEDILILGQLGELTLNTVPFHPKVNML